MIDDTISVIVSVYNVLPYLEKCVESILKQQYCNIELILVDDGSTDGSGKLCDNMAMRDSRVIVVHKENGGNASARNAGISIAKGEFISFVDADDWIEENMYYSMVAEMENSHVSLVCCGITLTDIEGVDRVCACESKKVFTREQAMEDFWLRTGNVGPSACNKLFRRKLFDGGVRFNENVIHEDTEAMPRFLNQTEMVVVLDNAFYHYIKRKNSASTSKKFSLRGYYILDSMKEYEKMCRSEFPSLLPTFFNYRLFTTYEMYLNLMSCDDYKKYFIQQFSLRRQILRSIFKCLVRSQDRKKNENQYKIMFARAVLGFRGANAIFHLK